MSLQATAGLAFARGSLLEALHEEDLRSRPLELNLTLVHDSWVELLELKFAHLLILGLASTSTPGSSSSWDAVFRDHLRPRDVKRVDATTVTVTLPARPAYDIARPETISIVIPPSAVLSNRTLVAQPALRVLPLPGAAMLTSPAPVSNEMVLRAAAEYPLQLLLVNDTFNDGVLDHEASGSVFPAVLHGLRTAALGHEILAEEPGGWRSIVQAKGGLDHTHCVLTAESRRITVNLPQQADYEISRPESLTLSVPPAAVASGQRLRAKGVVRIDVAQGMAMLSGSLIETPTEAAIGAADGVTCFVLLDGDTWIDTLGMNDLATAQLISGFKSAQNEPNGWNTVVQRGLDYRSVTKLNASVLRLDIPQFGQYSVSEPETLTLHLPKTAVASNLPLNAAPSVVLRATPGRATLGGDLAMAPTEANLRLAGAETQQREGALTITLEDDMWSESVRRAALWATNGEAVKAERAVVEQLVLGMLAEQDEPGGWNARVRSLLIAGSNVTLDGATLGVSLPAVPRYAIIEPETVFITVPPSAVSSGAPIRVSPPLVVLAERRTAQFGGHLFQNAEEATLNSDVLSNLTVILEGDSWLPSVGLPHLGSAEYDLQRRIVAGFVSSQDSTDPGGWQNIVAKGLRAEDVQRLDDRTLLVDLRQFAHFAISAPETIVAALPRDAFISGAVPVFAAPLVIRPTLSRARLSGTLLTEASEASLRSAATLDLRVTLTGDDAWAPEVGRLESAADFAIARALLDGIVPSLNEAHSWTSVVSPRLTEKHLARRDPRTVVVELPQFIHYDIVEPEYLTVTVPGKALRSGRSIVATPQMRILASNGTLQLCGTLLTNPTELSIQNLDLPAPTIRLDLLQDSWATGIGETHSLNGTLLSRNPEASALLLGSLTSQQSELSGWHRVIQGALLPTDITRLANSSIEIRLPDARERYDISEPETLTLTAPESSLLSGRQVVGLPQLVLLPTPGFGALSNSLVSNNSETDVQGGGMKLTVTLQGDSWAPSVGQRGSGTADSLTKQVLRAFISAQDESGGWK